MATSGTKKPFAAGSCVHEFEAAIFDAIGTTDCRVAVGTLHSAGFADEGITFLVDGKAAIVSGSGFRSDNFRADHAAGDVLVHEGRGARQGDS
jgi:hypothetical protein